MTLRPGLAGGVTAGRRYAHCASYSGLGTPDGCGRCGFGTGVGPDTPGCSILRSTSSLGPIRRDRAVGQRQDLIHASQRRRPVRDHNHDAAARTHRTDGNRQRVVACCIEVGIWFIKHDQERIAVKRAGKGDALALSAGNDWPPSPISVS